MNTRELLQKVRKIEIKAKGLTNQLFAGDYQSSFKGRGMSFAEVAEYQYGDDVRNIDWNVTARLNHPYIKHFEEERELNVVLLVDLSRSEYFGSRYAFKSELAAEIAGLLAFSAIKNNDKAGLLLFTDKVEKYIPPAKGKSHILRLIRDMINFSPAGKGTNISEALAYLNRVIKKKSIVFLLSDFIDKDYEKALSIVARKHDLIGIQLMDHLEKELPRLGFIPMNDLESGTTRWINTSSSKVRKNYESWRHNLMNEVDTIFKSNKSDLIRLETGDSYIQSLHQFFQKRSRR